MKYRTLYEILNIKRKNSILKSVTITNKITEEGYPIIEVEPYDDTFLNAISTVEKYDNTIDRIIDKLRDCYGDTPFWLSVSTDNYGHTEMLVTKDKVF